MVTEQHRCTCFQIVPQKCLACRGRAHQERLHPRAACGVCGLALFTGDELDRKQCTQCFYRGAMF